MKSEHRHELKTNELAAWLANFPQWARENAKMIIYVSIVVILVAVAYFYKRYQKNVVSVQKFVRYTEVISGILPTKMQILQAQTQGIDTSYALLDRAKNLQVSAQNAETDEMAALALIKQGQLLRTELHYRLEKVSQENLTNQINQAKNCYFQAIEKLSGSVVTGSQAQKTLANPSLIAIAKFGVGLCEEELGNFELAKKIYQDITTVHEFENTTVVTSAKHRLSLMADFQKKIVFRPPPKPAPIIPQQPKTEAQTPQSLAEPNTNIAVEANLPGK